MKRRGWWIAGGILLLWISPIPYAFFKNYGFKKDVDYTEYWKAHNAQVAWDVKVSQIRDEIRRSKYSKGSSPSDGGEVERGTEVVYVDRPVVVEKEVYRPSYQPSQPDLTGVYWQRNYGTFQFVLGPL